MTFAPLLLRPDPWRQPRRGTLAALLALASLGVPAAPSPHERLTGIAEAYVATIAEDDPLTATALGLPAADGKLAIPSEAARAARISRLERWKAEIEATLQAAGSAISLSDVNDARLLRAEFDSQKNELVVRQSDRKDYAAPALRLVDGLFTQFLYLPMVGREGARPADVDRAWDDIVSRLERGPAFVVAGQRLVTRPGRLFGTVGSRRLEGVPEFIGGALSEAAQAQLAGRPEVLRRFVAGRDALLATVAETRAYIDAHFASWPDNHVIGKAAYEQMLHDEQLLPFDSSDLERMARDELAHGWAEEAWLTAVSRQKKIPFGAASGGGMAPAGPALVGYYRDRIAELRAFVIAQEIVTVPDWLGVMEIAETPAFLQPVSPGASMRSPRRFAKSTTGYYFITPPVSLAEAAERLDMNQDFDHDRILSTAAHEAIPGHFLQLSIARRHPNFIRRILDDSSLAEGWAFYGEEMFVRLGLYGDHLDARLFTARWERVRGARAIVDPKLASGEWTVAQAIDFYAANSGFTRQAAEAAVHGIALGPGYVISYTVGRLQLQTLLAEYMLRTGERGSLRDFHDRLLSYGPVPFAVLGPELLADLGKPASVVRAAANY